jgi:hypothetical protein
MGFWSRHKKTSSSSSKEMKEEEGPRVKRSQTLSASSFMKYQARRLTRILQRRSTRKSPSPKAILHRKSMFARRATLLSSSSSTFSSPSLSEPSSTSTSSSRRRTTTTLNLHPGVSRMIKRYKDEISKQIQISPPPWCCECESARASKMCKLCGPTLFFCEKCARALHLGVRSKRDHVLETHPDFEAYQGYKGSNDPDSPACRPVQTTISELRPLTAINNEIVASDNVFQRTKQRQHQQHISSSSSSSSTTTHQNSRPKFRISDKTYPGDIVVFKTHIVRGDRRDVEVRGNVLEIRHTTLTRRSYLVRFSFLENGFKRTGLQLVPECDLETPKENRLRKLRRATRCIVHGKSIQAFEKWRDMFIAQRHEEDRLAAALFLQRYYRGHASRVLFLKRRDAHREEIRKREREKRRLNRERERRRKQLFGKRNQVQQGKFAIGQTAMRFQTKRALEMWCYKFGTRCKSIQQLVADRLKRAALERWRTILDLSLTDLIGDPVLTELEHSLRHRSSFSSSVPDFHVHPSRGITLPPLPGTGTELCRTGKVKILDFVKYKHFRDQITGPTDGSFWLVCIRLSLYSIDVTCIIYLAHISLTHIHTRLTYITDQG